MKIILALLTLMTTLATTIAADERCFEMRVYYAAPGKLDALHARFRDHTCKLFEKHGMTNLGYFVPLDNPESKLIYFLAYPNREARDKSWKAFMADPDWQKAYKASEVDGKLVAKVDAPLLTATDYSPLAKAENGGDRLFELRTYIAEPGRLDALHANIAYWTPMKGQKGAEDTLIYIRAYKNMDAAKASIEGFRKDPEWIAAFKASEEKAGGSLTTKDGVQSIYMKATDYSAVK